MVVSVLCFFLAVLWICFMCVSRGGDRGSGPPLKNHKNIGFSSNTGPDPLKNREATKPAFNVGPSLACQGKAIKWHSAGGPMMACL